MGIGPVPAVKKLFARTGLSSNRWTWSSSTRRSRAQALAVLEGWDWNDADRLNVNGGGISLGHPIGATGLRILATMLSRVGQKAGPLRAGDDVRGGGQGLAAVFERAA
jgi:acetyl-CoA C-acetyltransferase